MSPLRACVGLVLSLVVASSAFGQAPPPPDAKKQVKAAVLKTVPGNDKMNYVVVLMEVTPDATTGVVTGLALFADVMAFPVQAAMYLGGEKNAPFVFSRTAAKVTGPPTPAVTAGVGVFVGRNDTADALTDYVLAAPPGKVRRFAVLKRYVGHDNAVKAADAEKARLDKVAKKQKNLTVERREDDEPAK